MLLIVVHVIFLISKLKRTNKNQHIIKRKIMHIHSILEIFLLITFIVRAQSTLAYGYYNYDELTTLLKNYASQYPTKTYLYSIGKTVQGRDMWVLALSDTKPDQSVLLRPEGKYVGNIHGNEPTSKAVLLQFIDFLLTNPTDPDVDYLMKNTRIHVLASMNPDGFEKSYINDCSSVTGRYNGNNYDLNRNFQDLFECNSAPLQSESLAIIHWLKDNKFVISASLHSGAMVVNYPFDNYKGASSGSARPNLADDNDLFVSMAKNYSFNHLTMRNDPCYDGFTDGITNGGINYLLNN